MAQLSARTAAAAVQAVLTRAATWRLKPQRSAAASKRRREKGKERKRARASGSSEATPADPGGDAVDAAGGGGEPGGGEPSDDTPREQQLLSELLATRLALKDRTAVLALTRKQLRRETKTAKVRFSKLARQGSKAQKKMSRKLFGKQARAIAHAAQRVRAEERT